MTPLLIPPRVAVALVLALALINRLEAGKLASPHSFLKQTVNKLADEGGGVHFDGETAKLREEFVKLNPDSIEAKKQMRAEAGEKTEQSKSKPNP